MGDTNVIMKKLLAIQSKLKAPKSQFNKFGNYNYRNCEDILEALKPLLLEQNASIVISDEICHIGERYYVKATVIIRDIDSGYEIASVGFAREEETKKGMDGSQITGASSSYARKYALNGLFAIDDTKDSDNTNTHGEEELPKKTEPKEFKSDKPKNENAISEAQAKRLFAISKGNTELVKRTCLKYGFSSSKDVTKDVYNTICEEIEHEAMQQEAS